MKQRTLPLTLLLGSLVACGSAWSKTQAQQLKKASQAGTLTADEMLAPRSQEKKAEQGKVIFTEDALRKHFPKSYTPQRMQETILKLLEQWQRKRQREQARSSHIKATGQSSPLCPVFHLPQNFCGYFYANKLEEF